MARKRIDPKAKQKRQVMILVAGLGVLAVVLAIQLPGVLKSQSASSSAPASTPAATPSPTPTPTPPQPQISFADTELDPVPGVGQLISFSRFEQKDPFIQQVKLGDQPGSSGSSGKGSSSSAPPVVPPTVPTDPSVTPTPTPSPSPSPTPAPAPAEEPVLAAATISVNGTDETVAIGAAFPAADPIFQLVSLTKDAAKIAIAGGTFESGDATASLTKDTPLVLLNTANGVRYELRLVSVSSEAPSTSADSGSGESDAGSGTETP